MPRDAVTGVQGWGVLVPGMGVTDAQGWRWSVPKDARGWCPGMAVAGIQQSKVLPCLVAAVPPPAWHRAVWDLRLSIIYSKAKVGWVCLESPTKPNQPSCLKTSREEIMGFFQAIFLPETEKLRKYRIGCNSMILSWIIVPVRGFSGCVTKFYMSG